MICICFWFQILPPTADSAPPETVPVLVPTLVPVVQPKVEVPDVDINTKDQLDNERMDELMARLSVQSDDELLDLVMTKLGAVLEGFKSIFTVSLYFG